MTAEVILLLAEVLVVVKMAVVIAVVRYCQY